MKDSEIMIKKSILKDVDILYNIYSDKGVIKHQNRHPMKKKIQAYGFFLKNYISIYSIKKEKQTVGFIFYYKGKEENKIHFILEKKYRNKGIMKKALYLFIKQYAKRKRIIAFVNENNLAAIKVLENIKFKREKMEQSNKVNLYTGNLDHLFVYSWIESNIMGR